MDTHNLLIEEKALELYTIRQLKDIAREMGCRITRTKPNLIYSIRQIHLRNAVKNRDLEKVKQLCEMGIEWINPPDLMIFAARSGSLKIIKYLLSIGIEYSSLVMDYAAKDGRLNIVKYLYSIGRSGSQLAMEWAIEKNHLKTTKYLYSIGFKVPVLAMDWAATHGNLEMAQYINSIGANACENGYRKEKLNFKLSPSNQ